MRSALCIAAALILEASCASSHVPQGSHQDGPNLHASGAVESAQTGSNEPAVAAPEGERKDVPPAFRGVDFGNFTYPVSWVRGRVRLEGGTYEYAAPAGGGGDTLDLEDVGYADVTGDGAEDAVVHLLLVSCGGSCDGGSHLFYVYSADRNRLRLVWRVETGSLAYGCGLKSFEAKGGTITLEGFRECRLAGRSLVSKDNPKELSKFEAQGSTRFHFKFDGGTFAQEKREHFPGAGVDVRNYSASIVIGNG